MNNIQSESTFNYEQQHDTLDRNSLLNQAVLEEKRQKKVTYVSASLFFGSIVSLVLTVKYMPINVDSLGFFISSKQQFFTFYFRDPLDIQNVKYIFTDFQVKIDSQYYQSKLAANDKKSNLFICIDKSTYLSEIQWTIFQNALIDQQTFFFNQGKLQIFQNLYLGYLSENLEVQNVQDQNQYKKFINQNWQEEDESNIQLCLDKSIEYLKQTSSNQELGIILVTGKQYPQLKIQEFKSLLQSIYQSRNIKSRVSVLAFGEQIDARQLYELMDSSTESGNFSYVNSSSQNLFKTYYEAIKDCWAPSFSQSNKPKIIFKNVIAGNLSQTKGNFIQQTQKYNNISGQFVVPSSFFTQNSNTYAAGIQNFGKINYFENQNIRFSQASFANQFQAQVYYSHILIKNMIEEYLNGYKDENYVNLNVTIDKLINYYQNVEWGCQDYGFPDKPKILNPELKYETDKISERLQNMMEIIKNIKKVPDNKQLIQILVYMYESQGYTERQQVFDLKIGVVYQNCRCMIANLCGCL